MAYEQKDLTGSLFKNDRKEQDTHADYRGNALIDGVEYWLDAWINEPKGGGQKYMSLRFKAKDGQPQQRQSPSRGYAPAPADLDDDIPF